MKLLWGWHLTRRPSRRVGTYPRGTCPGCGRDLALTRDGRHVQFHQPCADAEAERDALRQERDEQCQFKAEARAAQYQTELELGRLRARLAQEQACTLGVGEGGGQLFVHGDYESIKTCQEKLFRMERAEAALAQCEARCERWASRFSAAMAQADTAE